MSKVRIQIYYEAAIQYEFELPERYVALTARGAEDLTEEESGELIDEIVDNHIKPKEDTIIKLVESIPGVTLPCGLDYQDNDEPEVIE